MKNPTKKISVEKTNKETFEEYLCKQTPEERIEAHLIQEQTAEFSIRALMMTVMTTTTPKLTNRKA